MRPPRHEAGAEAEAPPLLGAHSALPLGASLAQRPPPIAAPRPAWAGAGAPGSAGPAAGAAAAPPRFRAVQISLLRRSRTRPGEWERVTPVVEPAGAASALFFDVAPNEELRLRLADPAADGDAPWAGARVAVAIAPVLAGVRQATSAELVMPIGKKGDSVESFAFGAPPNAQAEMVSSWLEPAYGPIGRDRIVLRFSGAPLEPPRPASASAGPPAPPRKRPAAEAPPEPPPARGRGEGAPPRPRRALRARAGSAPPAPPLPPPLVAPPLPNAVPPAPPPPSPRPPSPRAVPG
eukprot:tig00021339_g20428.t1